MESEEVSTEPVVHAQTNGSLPLGSAGAILAAQDIEEADVQVPEWGCSVHVVGFTKRAQQHLRRLATDASGEIDNEKLEGLMFIEAVRLEGGERFSADDYEALLEKSAGAVDRVLTKILEVSGMSPGFRAANEAKPSPGPGGN